MLVLTPDQHLLLTTVVEESRRLQMPTYLVGGVVRDLLLGYSTQEKDFDFIVVGDADQLAAACAGRLGGQVRTFRTFLTAKLIAPSQLRSLSEVDFASARGERYESPGALPVVVRATRIEDDVARRDFTVNAIALPLEQVLSCALAGGLESAKLKSFAIDRFGGIPDLERGLIRILHPESFKDDPTRIFRAARYVSRLNGSLAPDTAAHLKDSVACGVCRLASWARTANELRKVASEHRWTQAIELLQQWGVFSSLGLADPGAAASNWKALRSDPDSTPGNKVLGGGPTFPHEEVFLAILAVLTAPFDETKKTVLVGMNLSKKTKSRIEQLAQFYVSETHVSGSNARVDQNVGSVGQALIDMAAGRGRSDKL